MKRQNPKNLNFKFSIVEYIRQNNILPNWLNSKASMSYYLKPLKIGGVLINPEKSIWYVDWNKWEEYYKKEVKKVSDKSGNLVKKKGKGTSPLVRGHGFQFYLKIPKRFLWNSETRKKLIEKTNLANRKIEHGIYKIRVLGHKIWFCEEGILVYFPPNLDYRGDSAKDTKNQAIYEFKRVIKRISNLIRLDLTEKGKLLFTVDKQHYADIEHELAIEYNNVKKKFKVVGDDGKVWLLIDFSHRINEFEYVDSKKSDVDRDECLAPHFNDLRQHYQQTGEAIKISSILFVLNKMGKQITDVTKNQAIFDANMKSHISAVKGLGKGVSKLNKLLDKM